MSTFLFELGTEELPAAELPTAIAALKRHFESAINAAGLEVDELEIYSTPRRLAVLARGVADKAPDVEERVQGPPASVAWSADGEPTKALLGFARKQGLDPSSVERVSTPRGEYSEALVVRVGASAAEVLSAAIESSFNALPWKRKMRWGWGDLSFARPVRWIVALLNSEVLPVSFGHIRADRFSRGHRFLAPQAIELTNPGDYLDALRAAFVEPDYNKRRQDIDAGIRAAVAALGLQLVEDPELLDEVLHLIEWPTVLIGHFDEELLEVPREVLITSMRTHQRYFALDRADGQLANAFAFVSNMVVEDDSVVIAGNVRVLRARLEDARFFYAEDLKTPLAERSSQLERVTFMEGVGSLADKSARLNMVATAVAPLISPPLKPAELDATLKAAPLAKADLVTGMVGEFPDLQGTIGRYYALQGGASAEVAAAIEEHWLPRGASDPPAPSRAGQLLAITDKLDTIAAAFSLGLKPTATADPFALRRAALGIIRTLHAAHWAIDLEAAIKIAVDQIAAQIDKEAYLDAYADIFSFIRGRAAAWFSEHAHADTVDAVLSTSLGDPHEAQARIIALAAFKLEPGFEGLLRAYRRASNILASDGEAAAAEVDPALFGIAEEQGLYDAIVNRGAIDAASADERARWLASLADPLEAFFDKVMVNVEDAGLRGNRLALLRDLQALFIDFADFSRLHVGPVTSEGAK